MSLRTTFLWSMIASLGIAAGLGVLAILIDDLGADGEKILATSLLIGAYSMICLVCAFVLDRRRARAIMWIGIATAGIALVLWLTLIWFDAWAWPNNRDEIVIKAGITTTVTCVWAAHYGLMILLSIHRTSWRLVRTITLVLTALLGFVIICVAIAEEFEDWTAKVIGVLSILGTCGTIVSPVLAVIERLKTRDQPVALERRVTVSLTCPRCETTQTMKTGRNRCGACGLMIGLEIEEPRCHCGYPLYQLEGSQCPECGREIAASDRWQTRLTAEAEEAPP